MNVCIEREHVQEKSEDLEGGWHTEGSLALLPGWDSCLGEMTSEITACMYAFFQ